MLRDSEGSVDYCFGLKGSETMNHNCSICRGSRPHNGSVCLGCGTPLAKATLKKTDRRNTTECPGCRHNGPFQDIGGRLRCGKCTAVFEGSDFGFVDDRPDVNAEKMERLAARGRVRRK